MPQPEFNDGAMMRSKSVARAVARAALSTWRVPLAAAVVCAAVATGAPAAPAAPGAVTAVPFQGSTTVTLITGDKIAVVGGHLVLPAQKKGGFETFQAADGDQYVIPAIAQPYLGRVLDLSLFDVSALLRGSGANGGRIPLTVSFARGAAHQTPAWIAPTATSGDTVQGYLNPAAAASFADVLRQRIGADVAAGRQPGTTPLMAGLSGIGVTGHAVFHPAYPMRNVQITATGLDGKPASGGLVVLLNVDAFNRGSASVDIVDGLARVQVPAGDYSATAEFFTFDTDGNPTEVHQVVVNDFAVPDSGTAPRLDISEASADKLISVRTPRPATEDFVMGINYRTDKQGTTLGPGVEFPNVSYYVNSLPPPKVGSSHFLVQWGGHATNPSDAYRYDVGFASDDGIPANETYQVEPNQLATVSLRLSTDAGTPKSTGQLIGTAVDRIVERAGYSYIALDQEMPALLTQYLGTADGGGWFQGILTSNGELELASSTLTFRGGSSYQQDWLHGPLAAGFGRYRGPQECAGCAAGDTLSLQFGALNDSDPNHVGPPDLVAPVRRLHLYRNGASIFDQTGTGVVVKGLPQAPATYQAVFDYGDALQGITQSTRSHTELVFKNDPGKDAALPGTDTCERRVATAKCRVLPILTVNYGLNGTDLTNTSHSRTQTMNLTVGHLGYDGSGARYRITTASFAISYDHGKTWQRVPLHGAGGRYQATWTNPASGSPEFKVTAADAHGDTFEQTVDNAYTIGAGK